MQARRPRRISGGFVRLAAKGGIVSKKKRTGTRKAEKRTSKERADQVKKEQDRRQLRRSVILYSAVGLVAVALIGGAVLGVRSEKEAASAPIEGLAEVENQESDHVLEPIAATELPPTGGKHSATVQNCGTYEQPVAGENAVHSLEHGAVWLSYRPDAPLADVEVLRSYAKDKTYILVAPYPDLAAPVVATAWGRQLELPNAQDPRLDRFVKRFREGRQAPEPGAPCTGGTGNPI